MAGTSESTTSESGSFLVDGSAIGIAALLAFAAIVFVLFRRFSGPVLPDTPASSRWVAWLRVLTDVALGIVVVSLVAACIGFLLGSDGLSLNSGPLRVGDGGIALSFDTRTSETVGDPRGVQRAREAVNEAGKGFVADDYALAETKDRYGRYASVVDARKINLDVPDPSPSIWAAAVFTLVLSFGAIMAFLYALRQVLERARRGDPFHPRTVFWLRVMAGALVVHTFGVTFGRQAVARLIASDGGAAEHMPLGLEFYGLGGAFILLALGEVWRYGVALQRDAEATV